MKKIIDRYQVDKITKFFTGIPIKRTHFEDKCDSSTTVQYKWVSHKIIK